MPAMTFQLLDSFTRLRDMLNVLLPPRTRGTPRVWHLFLGALGLALVALPLQQAHAQRPTPKNERKSQPADPKDDQDDDNQAKGKNAAGAAEKKGDGAPGADDDDGASKALPFDIYRDPAAEELLDINTFPELNTTKPKITEPERLQFNGMAGGVEQLQLGLMTRVVDAMVAQLTDHSNIQAVLEPSTKPNAPSSKAINYAANALLEPIFLARVNKNQAFMLSYTRVLDSKLAPVLKNHLVPRVQAMIILGQAGSGDLLKTYLAQIKDPNQTVWVKLWAFEGIANAIEEGARIPGDQQASTAKIIADFLVVNSPDAPPPVQLRALEALAALKQGAEINHPERVTIATAAMKFLANPEGKFEIRAEAARALGLMQIPPAARKFNFPLVAYSTGLLVADMGTQINTLIPEREVKSASSKAAAAPDAAKPATKPAGKLAAKNAKGKAKAAAAAKEAAPARARTNPVKARFLTTLLIGPIYQAFEGVPGIRAQPEESSAMPPAITRRTARRSSIWSSQSPRRRLSCSPRAHGRSTIRRKICWHGWKRCATSSKRTPLATANWFKGEKTFLSRK